ncbi:hypothetical protein BCY91_09855 [Pelobium manganitolerans]|uniref:Uncharacterized protein n=1 Tax=Pelobium manganitolerans TaxID=1842495 RepID=A0A419S3U9_9SPHI|nr:hypothetical protein BCY91_09855 [Pelobium manganitolerans]
MIKEKRMAITGYSYMLPQPPPALIRESFEKMGAFLEAVSKKSRRKVQKCGKTRQSPAKPSKVRQRAFRK